MSHADLTYYLTYLLNKHKSVPEILATFSDVLSTREELTEEVKEKQYLNAAGDIVFKAAKQVETLRKRY